MYHRERRKMKQLFIFAVLSLPCSTYPKHVEVTQNSITKDPIEDNFENNVIDFDEDYSLKFNKKYETVPWHSSEKFNKESHRYTVVKDDVSTQQNDTNKTSDKELQRKINEAMTQLEDTTSMTDYSVIPLELISTTENELLSIIESTADPDLTVIPLSTTQKALPEVDLGPTVSLPVSSTSSEISSESTTLIVTTVAIERKAAENHGTTTFKPEMTTEAKNPATETTENEPTTSDMPEINVTLKLEALFNFTTESTREIETTTENTNSNSTRTLTENSNSSKSINNATKKMETRADFVSSESGEEVPIFTELDTEDAPEVPEDYYDTKDVVPTGAPKTDALSVIFGLAGSMVESVVESVAERVVPKSIFDLFKRMQRQSEALEAERLRSREENGGLGQFTRGIIKTISTGISKPLSQLMAGVRDIGSLDTDRGFVSSVASGVTSVANVANSLVDAFKDRVQAIYPGTVWCGDGHSATARSSDLGLFFFTDTCCRQHDACKLYIRAGETKYGLTNTGLFTRSHCGCDLKFRDCLRRTSSLVSAQIGLTYFNVLGPQCFRKAHPIIRCLKRTRLTGQKCEEYELDYTKPKMWQWFDNETF